MINIGVFDIETDGFLDVLTQIHVLIIEDFETGAIHTFRSDKIGSIEFGLNLLSKIPLLVGHNIIDFDLPAIKKLYPAWHHQGEIFDTLPAVRTIWSDIKSSDFNLARKGKLSTENIGRHSLSAWGQRIGLLKGDYGKTSNWSKLDEDMVTYCIQDVKVNSKLYHLIIRKEYPEHVLKMEQEIHRLCLEQTKFGFPFNINKAEKLLGKLLTRKAELSHTLHSSMGPGWVQNMGEKCSKRTVKYKDPLRGNETAGCFYTKVKFVEFNPNSRTHLTRQLQNRFGWKPNADEYGDDGIPNLDEEILSALNLPVAKDISEFLMIGKRLGSLVEGKQAWLKKEVNGSIHGRVNTMGAITTRCTHSDPNMAQIPANDAPYGHECRELFEVKKGEYLLGCDVSGLELRMLAHYMAKWDNGEYGKIILEGDIHSANQKAAGLPTRGNAKTFIYGFLYGAGDAKIGSIINGTSAQGKKLKEQFLNNTPALKKLREAVSDAVDTNKKLKALDGRYIPVRHKHAALNTLLQSAGAIVCKLWVVKFHQILKERGYVHGVDYYQANYVHDELQIRVNEKTFPIIERDGKKTSLLGDLCVEAIQLVGTDLNIRLPLDGEYKIGTNYAETH